MGDFDAKLHPTPVMQPDEVSSNVQAVYNEVIKMTEADQKTLFDVLPDDNAVVRMVRKGPPPMGEKSDITLPSVSGKQFDESSNVQPVKNEVTNKTEQQTLPDADYDEMLRERAEELKVLIAAGVQHPLTRAEELKVLARWQQQQQQQQQQQKRT